MENLTHTNKPDFILERSEDKFLSVGFMKGTHRENFGEKISQLIEYALAKKQEIGTKLIILSIDRCLGDNWITFSQILPNFKDKLTSIDILDFQHSDFPKITLFDIGLLYEEFDSMENLPRIYIEDTFAHDDSDDIVKTLKITQKGQEFLKRIYFSGNRDYEKIPNL